MHGTGPNVAIRSGQPADKGGHARAGRLQQAGVETKADPHMALGIGAKGIARQNGHRLLSQQTIGEGEGGKPRLAYIQQHEHRAFRAVQGKARHLIQPGKDQIAPGPDGVVQARHLGNGDGVGEGGKRRVLHKGRRTIEHAQRQLCHMTGQFHRPHHPADPPAGHGMGLGQAGNRGRALGHARQAGNGDPVVGEDEGRIDLIREHPEVVSAASGVLIWLSLYHLGDATQVMCFFMLRCYKITVMPLLIYCIFLWGVGLMGGYQLAYHGLAALDWPAMPSPKTFWLSNTAAVFAVCMCMLALLNWVSKKSIQER